MSCRTPVREVMRIEHDAQEIAGEETILCCLNSDHTHDEAIQRSDDPAEPEPLSDENRGEDRKKTRNIVEMIHVLFAGAFLR